MFRTYLTVVVSVLALTGCPPEKDPQQTECPQDGLAFSGSLGLNVDFTGRVDGEGGTATSGATLYSAPAATLIVPISMREQFEVTPTLLTFTPENWNVPQQLTVRAKAGVKTSDLTDGTSTSLLLGPTESERPELRCQTGTWGTVPLPRCGDGVLDSFRGEKCEPPNPRLVCPLGQASCQVCNADCQFVAGVPNVCGDGMVTADEECDGQATRTCQQLGFDFGTPKCGASTCRYDTSDCVKLACDGSTCDPKFPASAPVDDAFCLLGADSRARCFGSSTVGHHRPPVGPLSQLADGIAHACGVAPGGQGQCWGRNLSQEATPAPGPFSKIVVGHYHSCGLTPAGAVSCWGSNDYRFSQVPSGGPFTDLASGDNHVCALTTSGEVKCWGRRAEAQTFPPSGVRFTRIAAAANHGCGLTAMGDITCWGNFGPGKTPLKMVDAWPFVDLVVLRQDVCGLTADARIVCSAMNTGDLALPVGFVPVSLGDASSGLCALNAEGAAHCWGSPYAHEPLVGRFSRVDTGQQFCGQRIDGGITCGRASVTSDVPLKQFIIPNNNTSCGVTVDGTANCTMRWTQGGMSRTASAPPVPFERVAIFDDVACGLRTNGTVVCWGDVPNGGTGIPQDVMTDFAHNGSTGCGILTSGALSCWGIDPFGIRTPPSGTFTQVRMNRLFACALRTDGSVACWGTEVTPPPAGTGFTALSMSEYQGLCALGADAGLTCWGKRQQTQVPWENFSSLTAGMESASGRTLDGGLRHFDVAAFENGSLALVEARIDSLAVGGRSFCLRSGEGVMCLSPEGRGVTQLRETAGGPLVTDDGQCWLLDGGLPRCNFGATPPQEPLKAISLGGRVWSGITIDGGHLIQSNGNKVTGPFIAVESTPLSWCVQGPSGGWACDGVPDAGVRTSLTEPFERLSIARSEDLACGLYGDGGTRCWGKGLTKPMASVPAGPWVDLRLGRSHGCGLHPGGSVECWGESQVGVLNAPTAQFSQIGSGNDFSCGIRSADRQLMCWGAYGVNWSQ